MRSFAVAGCLIVALGGVIVAARQTPQSAADPMVREHATVKVAPHVFVIPDNDIPLVPNVGIVVGSRATLVVDTGLGPRNGEAVAREAAKASPNRDWYLAVTHVHPEHDLGAQAFPAGTKMLRSAGQDRDIAEFGLQLANTFASQSPARAALLKDAAYRKTDIAFDQSYTLDLGGVRVHMTAVGPTHTRGDTVFFVEGDDVLFAGDVVMSAFPAFASPYSSVRAWLAALDRLEAMKPRIVVPSHGKLVDAGMIARYRDYLRLVQSRAGELKARGASADDAARIIQTEMQAKYADMAQPARIAGAARSAYAEAPSTGASSAEITLIAPGGIAAAIQRLIPEFEKATGYRVKATFGSGLGTKAQVVRGEPFDVPVVQPPYPDVIASGHVVAASATSLAKVAVGVAVRKGGAKPDVSTADAVKRLLLGAASIGYPNGANGAAAGVSIDRTLKTLGILDELQPKIKRAQGGAGAMAMVASGEVEIGLTFMSEMDAQGIDVVGALPREISTPTELVGFVSAHTKVPDAARALLRYLSSPEAARVYRSVGMQPAR
jgi:molybdenum ABC transporter molybdate-binding protein